MNNLWSRYVLANKQHFYLLPYFLLLGCIVLPYVLRKGLFLAGNDASFFEYSAFYNLERSLYYWRNLNGVGGESFQGASTIVYQIIIGAIHSVFGSIITQIITKIVFYSAGFWGVYLLLKEYAKLQQVQFVRLTASLLGYFYCLNLIGFDLMRTWLYLYYVFFLLTPLLVYFFIKSTVNTERRYFFGFLACVLLNQVVFSNASYPAIQYLVLITISLVFLSRIHWKRAIILMVAFSFFNAPFFFETVLTILYQRTGLFSNTVNTQLINDAPLVQQKFYSMFNILSFVSGRLLEGTRWTIEGSKSVFNSASFYVNFLVKYLLLVPVFLVVHSLTKKRPHGRELFIGSMFLVSAVLVSMFGFAPLSDLFSKIFNTFPLLWIFRNSLKFSVLLLLLAVFLLYGALEKSRFKVLFVVYLLGMSVYAFKGDYADTYSFTSIPPSYEQLPETIKKLGIDSGDRMMAFPAYGNLWLVYSFGYMGFHPLVSFQNQIASFTTNAYASGQASNAIYNELSSLTEETGRLFHKYNVKYVLLNHDLAYGAYRIDPAMYVKDRVFLDKHFKKITENQNYSIYQVTDEKNEIISGESVSYEIVNPTRYKVRLMNVTSSREILLNQAYSSGWRVYVEKTEPNITKQPHRFFTGDELRYLVRPDDVWWTHAVSNGYANSWSIDPREVLKEKGDTFVERNSDGSMNVTLTLFFQPQTYYYIGQLLSVVSIFAYFLYVCMRKFYVPKS